MTKVKKEKLKEKGVTDLPQESTFTPTGESVVEHATTTDESYIGKQPPKKTLGNTTASGAKVNVKDIQFWGNGDTFKLISKASSKNEGWMKSTKAMEIERVGCVVQVTTQQRNPDGSYAVAEALTFVPVASIREKFDDSGNVISRELVYKK